jgi:hypothetical protein
LVLRYAYGPTAERNPGGALRVWIEKNEGEVEVLIDNSRSHDDIALRLEHHYSVKDNVADDNPL